MTIWERGNMMCILWWAMIGITLCNPINPSRPGDMSDKAKQALYLERFGYMKNQGAQVTDDVFSEALAAFQKKWGLKETGEMNDETQTLMETPRCGCRDVYDEKDELRMKRFIIHRYGGWTKTDLTYHIVNNASTLPQTVTDDALKRALAEWSNISPLTFSEDLNSPDLKIFFVAYNHEDGYAFDGPSGVLAHAFFPAFGGDAHFDDSETWTIDANGAGIDLFLVGVHEFGHSLGLEHSEVREAIMYPFYTFQSSWSMSDDDKAGIQAIYGTNEVSTSTEVPSSSPTSETTTIPLSTPGQTTPVSQCVFNNIDAITSDRSGNIFVFHGNTYTLIDHNGIVDGFPRDIQTDFPEIDGVVDAAVYLPEIVRDRCVEKKGILRCYSIVRSEEVYLFSSTKYYKYGSGYLESKKRRKNGIISSEFTGIPLGTTLDAAFTYDGIDIYLASGDTVWRLERRNKKIETLVGYPKSLSNDLVYGLPTPLNDVLSMPTTSTYHNYFFLSDTYYRTTNGATSFDQNSTSYPRSINEWWCKNGLQNDLGFFKHHTVYLENNFNRIMAPSNIEL